MGHVVLNTGACNGVEVPVSSEAMKMVRMGFNPSQLPQVDRIKSLAAALISELENVGGREGSIAITQVQTASMFGVAAATAHL